MKLFSKMDDTMVNNMKNTIPENTKKGIETMKNKAIGGGTITDLIEKEKKNGAKATLPTKTDNVVNTPTPVTETKPTEAKTENSVVKENLTTESNVDNKDDNTSIVDRASASYDTASDAYKKGSQRYKEIATNNAKGVADKNTKDNVARLAKYLGGGVIGTIADTIGIYGDMVSTAKHNLAQAYFQAAGKGGQYKDPMSKEILQKKSAL